MSDEGLLESLDLGSARGGKRSRRGEPLFIEAVRSLTQEDLGLLENPPALESSFSGPAKLRYTHHQLARLLALGKDQVTASAITGYSQSFICNLLGHDKPFQELVRYYAENAEAIFVDVAERMKALGISALEELQERLEAEPEGWTKQQLMDLTELMVVKPLQASGRGLGININGPGGRQGGLQIGISFIQPQQETARTSERGEIIDLEGVEVEKTS